jgi:hypothetical protein
MFGIDDAIIAAVVTGGFGLAGTAMSMAGQEDTNKASAHEADINRQWQEYMSNTAHQREVEDLRKAGLNPLLSANNGASTGSPVMPTLNNPAKDTTANLMATAKAINEVKLTKELISTEKTKQLANVASANLQNSAKTVNDWESYMKKLAYPVMRMRKEWLTSRTGRKTFQLGEMTGAIGNLIRGSASLSGFSGSVKTAK